MDTKPISVIVSFMKHSFRAHRRAAVAATLVAASLVAACSTPAAEKPAAAETPAAGAPPYRPVASIREIMNSVIDPNIDPVWESVKSVLEHGVENGKMTDKAPISDEDWATVRAHALVVSEAANLLLMPNRPVAPPGAPSLAPGVELTPDEIRALIDKNPDGWNYFVQDLQDSLKPALAAIDKKDAEGLFAVGGRIDEACENCHAAFWYPKAAPPAPAK
jgi:hypothetical protein